MEKWEEASYIQGEAQHKTLFNTEVMAMILPFLGHFFCFLTCCSLFLQIIGKCKPHAAVSAATKEFNESRHFKQSRASMMLVPRKQTEKTAVCSTYSTVLTVNNHVGRNVAQRGRSSIFFIYFLPIGQRIQKDTCSGELDAEIHSPVFVLFSGQAPFIFG